MKNVKRFQEEHFLFLFLLCPYLFITFFSLSNISLPSSLPLTHTALFLSLSPLSSQHNISSLQIQDFPGLHVKDPSAQGGFSRSINLQENLIVVLIQVDTLIQLFGQEQHHLCHFTKRPCWGDITQGKEDEFPQEGSVIKNNTRNPLLSHSMAFFIQTLHFG